MLNPQQSNLKVKPTGRGERGEGLIIYLLINKTKSILI
jgi:hypothetical protein